MKYVSNFLKLSIFFLFLLGLFFVAPLVSYAASTTLADGKFESYQYFWDYSSNYNERISTVRYTDITSLFPVRDAYFASVAVRSNATTNFYQWTNTIIFEMNENVSYQENAFTITGHLFARNADFSLANFDYMKDMKLSLGSNTYEASYEQSIASGDYFPCSYEYISKDVYAYSCTFNNTSSVPKFLRIDFSNKPFIDATSTSAYALNSFLIGVAPNLNYEEALFLTPNIDLKTKDGEVTFDILNYNIFADDPNFSYFKITHKLSNFPVAFGKESSYTFKNIPNGTYSLSIAACGHGTQQCGPERTIYYSITSSKAPTAVFDIDDDVKSIIFDASKSFSFDGTFLSKYYFQIDDGAWYSSTTPKYTFVDKEYGQYTVRVKVEDKYGNVSNVLSKQFFHRSPEEKHAADERNFWQKILDWFESIGNFFNDFMEYWQSQINLMWINFAEATKRIFIPSSQDLSKWFSKLNNTVEKQFGFLNYPITWITTFLERFYGLQDNGHYIMSWPNVNVPNFDYSIIRAGSYDLASLLSNSSIKTFHDLYLMSLNALILLSFLNLCLNKLNEIFGGSTQEYFVTTESSSVVVDNQKQKVLRDTTSLSNSHTKKRRKL